MPHVEAVSGPAVFMMLVACVIAIGFLLRFLAALTLDERNMGVRTMRARNARPERVHYSADTAVGEFSYPKRMGSAAQLAIGVARITGALASNASLTSSHTSVDRLHVVTPGRPKQQLDFTARPRYRSG
jgi:hypothetical protein